MTAAVPIEKKRLMGNPGKRSLPKATQALTPMSAEPPEHLAESGAKLWSSLANLGALWLSHTDTPTILLACEMQDRRNAMLVTVISQGLMINTKSNGLIKHPLLPEITALEKQLASMFSSLGLTPADRSRLGVAEVKAASKLEGIRASQSRDREGDS